MVGSCTEAHETSAWAWPQQRLASAEIPLSRTAWGGQMRERSLCLASDSTGGVLHASTNHHR